MMRNVKINTAAADINRLIMGRAASRPRLCGVCGTGIVIRRIAEVFQPWCSAEAGKRGLNEKSTVGRAVKDRMLPRLLSWLLCGPFVLERAPRGERELKRDRGGRHGSGRRPPTPRSHLRARGFAIGAQTELRRLATSDPLPVNTCSADGSLLPWRRLYLLPEEVGSLCVRGRGSLHSFPAI